MTTREKARVQTAVIRLDPIPSWSGEVELDTTDLSVLVEELERNDPALTLSGTKKIKKEIRHD